MLISKKWGMVIAMQLMVITQANAAHKEHAPATRLEGYVRDGSGKPVKGVLVSVNQGSYTTQGGTDVIPLILPHAVGAIFIDNSDMTYTHHMNSHFVKTDRNGHYRFKKLSPGRYTFSVRGMKKYYGNFRTSEGGLVDNKKLNARYSFPTTDQVVVENGQTTLKDVILTDK